MTLRDKIEDDIRQSMRSQNRQRLDALRFLKSAIQLVEKDQQKVLDDTGVTEVITKQVKERRESIRMFEEGSRADLVAKESAELAVLEEYMPPQMSAEQLAALIREVSQQVGAETPRDKGKVMGRLMPQVRGRADGTQVSQVVTELLAG